MALNLGTSPYYDDFQENKNFHRILFKPGYAVQARELTQLQTILQNQIQRFGNHVFKDGSVVLGCAETFQFNVPFVKIAKQNSAGVDISPSSYLAYKKTLLNGTITNTLGVSAKIIFLDEDASIEQRVLYLNYQTASTDNLGDKTFHTGDVLTIQDSTGVTIGNKFQVISGGSITDASAIGLGSLYTIGDGIVYAQGTFVRHEESTKVLSYFTNTPTKNVGYRLATEKITSDSDITLLDPAAGSYNYAAPGADRYKISTVLESYEPSATPEEGFYLLFVVEEGTVKRAYNKPQYAELQKVLAQRTFDESGNYAVRGLNVNIREHLKEATNNGKFTISEGGNSSKILYGIEPGKAYVEGYENELKATQYLPVDKATDTDTFIEKVISTNFGSYVLVHTVKGTWDLTDNVIAVNLLDGASTIGTAKFRLLRFESGTSGSTSSGIYRLYLYDISAIGNADLTLVDTITASGGNTATVHGAFTVLESGYNSLLFPTTARAVVEFEDNTDYFFWKKLGTYTFAGNTTAQVTISGGQTFAFSANITNSAEIARNFLVVDNTSPYNIATITNVTYNGDTTATLTGTGLNSTYSVYAYVRQANGDPINLTLRTSFLNIDGTVLSGSSLTNFQNGIIYLGVTHALDIQGIYKSTDGFPGTFVDVQENWTDITSKCTLVNNQKDNYFDTSYITYDGTLTNADNVVIKFRHFTRDSSFGYLNRNSYRNSLIDFDPKAPIISSNRIYTYQLPIHKSQTTGISYDLRDVLDFRPAKSHRYPFLSIDAYNETTMANGENVLQLTFDTTSGIIVPDPNSILIATFSYNLPRKDKVILTRDGEFKVIKGTSSLNPVTPVDPPHAMALSVVELAPYPSLSTFAARQVGREDYSSNVRLIDNRRYTMRDIGDLDQRVSRLEYYTALSIMENKVANMIILQDPTDPTSIMAKKGILVDGFDGHDVGNIFDVDYNAAIDTKNKVLRAPFAVDNIDFVVETAPILIGQSAIGGTGTPTEIPVVENLYASKSRTCGNSLLRNFKTGFIKLDPPQSMWMDTNARPDVQINYNGTNDGWEFDNAPFSIHWDGWKTLWQGVELTTVNPINSSIVNGITGIRSYNESARLVSDITRSMIITNRLPENNVHVYGMRVIDISVVPYIKQQAVTFIATGMKPNAVVHAYLDGEDVSQHCRYFSNVNPSDLESLAAPILASQYEPTASQYGDTLIVDANGNLIGQFLIPSNTFRVGSRVFKFEDADLLLNEISTTLAATQFHATGITEIQDGSILSTRFADVRQDTLTDIQNNVVNRLTLSNPGTFNVASYGDPMAQTFIIENEPNGVFLSSVDLFFKNKSTTKGISIQIREVINGFPGNKIVPFSNVRLNSSDVIISDFGSLGDGSATNFKFEQPIFLKNNTEYSLVLLPENNDIDYQVWISELGENQLTTNEKISQQAYIGVLFVPNNNVTWTALENEDLTFRLNKYQFNTSQAEVILKSAPIDYVTFTEDGEHTLIPSDVVKVYKNLITTPLTVLNQLDGTIQVQAAMVTGTGTSFTTELKIGDRILFGDIANPTVLGIVKHINSNLSLELEESYGTVIAGTNAYLHPTTAEGYVVSVYDNMAKIYIESGSLSVNDEFTIRTAVTGDELSTTITINAIHDIIVSAIAPNIGILSLNPSTSVSLGYRFKDSPYLGYLNMMNEETLELPEQYVIYSYSTGEAITDIPTMKLQALLNNDDNNSNLTPILDTRKISLLALTNNISYEGNTAAKYITRAVTLDDSALDLRVFVDVKLPEECGITVYAKLGLGDSFDSSSWIQLQETSPTVVNRLIHQEYSYAVNDSDLVAFTKFAVKIEMYSGTSSLTTDITKTPLIKNFRAVALI